MKDLSIVIRANQDKILEYVSILEPLLLDEQSELIIINNSTEKMDIKHNYTLYEFSEKNSCFKEFCFSSSNGNKILLIDGNIQIDSIIVKDFILNIKSSNFNNTVYKMRKFLSLDKPIYYTSNQVLIYNRGIKGFHKESELMIDDFTLTDSSFLESNICKLVKHKYFDELYLWYKHFILKQQDDLKHKFYLLLEHEKTILENEDIMHIEELFTAGDMDIDYCNYLRIKKELRKESIPNTRLFTEKINSLVSLENSMYYSYIVYNIIKKRHDLSIILPGVDIRHLDSIINYLSGIEGFHENLYEFILYMYQPGDENEEFRSSKANILLIKSFIILASRLPVEIEIKKKLIELFKLYISIMEGLLKEGDYLAANFEPSERNLLINYEKAMMYLSEGDINKALDVLWALSIQYPDYEMALRYLIQGIRYEKNSYKATISICMIVKDEEKNLQRCLASLKPLLDTGSELIIVDTGSADNTVEIAKKHSKKVYFYNWKGSFSDARNYSLSLAQGEYILLLDGDEEIDYSEISKIVSKFSSPGHKAYNTFTLKIKNYTDVNLKEYAIITQPRIFRNTPCFHYSGKVHNQPVFNLPVKHLPVFITHYGYIMTEDIKDKKFHRTANMLKLELQKNPQNIYYRFQLSTSYAMHGDLKEALYQAEIYMRKIRLEQLSSADYIMYYNNAAILYISSHLLNEASDICDEALEITPDFIDFIYYKALICYETGEYEDALEYVNKYLNMIDGFMNMDIASDGRYSFYTLGLKEDVERMGILCSHRLGEYIDIINKTDRLDIFVCRKCLHAIINAFLKTGKYSDVIQLYNRLCTDSSLKIMFRYFLKYYVEKSDNREKLLCQSILTALDCFDDKDDEPVNKEYNRFGQDISEALSIVQGYDIDSLSLNEARGLFSKLLSEYSSLDTEKTTDIKEISTFKKLGLYILKHSSELKYYKDYSPIKQINILRKYMSLSSALIKNKRTDLLEAREQLFLIKITQAFKTLGKEDYAATVRLLMDAAHIFKPMEGIIELIIKNAIPGYKNSTDNSNSITIISSNSEEMKSYADVVKKKIAEAAGKNSPGAMLEVFAQYNEKKFYDSELFSYKSLLLMSEGMFHEAELELDQGLLQYPNDIRLLSNLSRLYSLTERFNKSLEVFCRAKLLYKDKCTLELKELIPDSFFRKTPIRPKVLHGTMFGNNRINKIAAELSNNGIYSKTLSYCPKYTGYAHDYVIDMNQYENGNDILLRTLDAASILIPEFDIFHFHYGSTLTFDYSDLPLLNYLGKGVLVQFYGDEIKIPGNNTVSPSLYKDKSKTVQEKLTALSKYISHCIVQDEAMEDYLKGYFKEIHIIKENEVNKLTDLYISLIFKGEL